MWLLVFLHTVSYALQFSAVGCLWLAVASAAPVLTPHSCILKPQKPFSHCFLCLCSAAQDGPLEQPVLECAGLGGSHEVSAGVLLAMWYEAPGSSVCLSRLQGTDEHTMDDVPSRASTFVSHCLLFRNMRWV